MDKPDPFRAEIEQLRSELGLTRNAVWRLVEGKVSRSQVYDYLDGESDMLSREVAAILGALREAKGRQK